MFGVETDFDAFDLDASRTSSALIPVAGAGGSFFVSSAMDTNWLWTGRARVGWAISNALVFATGGIAVTDLHVSNAYRDNVSFAVGANGTGAASVSKDKVGYAVGGGVEWALTRNWTIKGEYLFVDFGDVQVTSVVTTRP